MAGSGSRARLEERLENLEARLELLSEEEDFAESPPEAITPSGYLNLLRSHFTDFQDRTARLTSAFRGFSTECDKPAIPNDSGAPPPPPPRETRSGNDFLLIPPDHPVLKVPRRSDYPTFYLPDGQTTLNFPTVASLRQQSRLPSASG
jgi:hypothetical protein